MARELTDAAGRVKGMAILATYQEPSLIYAFGRPAPVMRDRRWLLEVLRREGSIVTALSPMELTKLRADSRLEIEVRGEIQGFHLNKGRTESLRLAVIRPGGADLADSALDSGTPTVRD